MPRGRPKKATKLKLLHGDCPPGTASSPLAGGVPDCPPGLSAEAKREWREICADLDGLGLLARADRRVIAGLAQAWANWLAARKLLFTKGRYYTVRGYEIARPAVADEKEAVKQIKDLSAILGLDPTSRSKLHVQPKGEERSELEKYLGGGA